MKAGLQDNSACRCKKRALGALCYACFLLTVPAERAQAFDTYQAVIADDAHGILARGYVPDRKSLSPSMVDQCLPLLNSIHHDSSNSAMDRNQRPAGNKAPLGLVFGVRLSLAPPYKTGAIAHKHATARFDIWEPQGAFEGDRQALAMSSYRQCQKDRAFQALGNLE